MSKKVLVIGWDAADWKVIQPLLEAGEMPTLKKFLSEGVYGNISTMDPPLSPILWTTIATGKLPEQHGILNFVEPDNLNGGIKPVSSLSRKSKAIWNILNQNGLTSNVIGWWPSNPAEPINGIMVSNLYAKSDKTPEDYWPMRPGTIYPAELEDTFAGLRIHPGELTEQHIVPFVPAALTVNNENNEQLATLATMLAETATIQSALTWAMENKPADFTAVYFDGIDHFSHAFMKFHPPRFSEKIPEDLYNLYKDVVKSAYKFHDMMLERQLELAGEDATVIILSDHGFHSDHHRLLRVPKEPSGPTYEHRDYGIFCMKGPGIKKDHKLFGVTLADITPTLLTIFGLPVGKDMAGKPLLAAFENSIAPDFIESWENIEGDTGAHPSDMIEDPVEAHEALVQLVELGYIEDPGKDKNKASESAVREIQYNLGRSLLFTRSFEKALPVFESLHQKFNETRFSLHYIHCLLQLKKTEKCRSVVNELIVKNTTLPSSLRYQEASLLMQEKKIHSALEILKELEEKNGTQYGISLQLGNIYLSLDRYHDSISSFKKALDLDPENATAYYGLGICYFKLNQHEDASENFLSSIELIYYNPLAHYHLGESQAMLGETIYAIQAFESVIAMTPGMSKARHWLIKLYTQSGNKTMAEKHASFVKNNIQEKPIVIVSGLPRSGTSMMMQMLYEGGADILTDNIRTPDQNNPKGYFEYEPVKKLAETADWILEQSGKTIKIIAQLLPHLPSGHPYKIIFMEREMDEVLKSQEIMLSANKVNGAKGYPMALANTFDKQLTKITSWLERQPNIEVLYLNYSEVVEAPLVYAKKIEEFTGVELNTEAMSAAVDKTLYRNHNPVWK